MRNSPRRCGYARLGPDVIGQFPTSTPIGLFKMILHRYIKRHFPQLLYTGPTPRIKRPICTSLQAMAQRPKIQLRRYLRDSRAPVPRTTLWRHRKRATQHGAGPARVVSLPRPSISVPMPPPPPLSDPGSPPPSHSDQGSPPPSPSDQGSPPPSPSDQGSPPPSSSDQDSLQDPAPPPAVSDIPPLTVQDSPELFEPLYAGAQISLCGAMCAIMHFCSMHGLSYSAIKDLLQLLLLLFPGPNKLPSSLYHFQKFFFKFQSKKTSTRVCSDCHTLLSDCTCSLPRRTSPAHLITVSNLKPLQAIIFRKCG